MTTVGVLFTLQSCFRDGASAQTANATVYKRVPDVNAKIVNPIANFTGKSAKTCGCSCSKKASCRVFSLEMRVGLDPVCLLGGIDSTVQSDLTDISATLYYDRREDRAFRTLNRVIDSLRLARIASLTFAGQLVPPGYTFAMITNEIHFLKNMTADMNFSTGVAACKTDKANLVQDDKGVAWHKHIIQYATSKIGAMKNFWLGGNDLDGNHVYHWNDGTPVSGQTFWHSGEPSFKFNKIPEQCMELPWTYGGSNVTDEWNDTDCSNVRAVICEIRLP
ncbi:unnamed protein product [Darwinula stevensoni]|uniref:C-type lectin domain-containing protein n=1 Tax=Darwinula stevensoni TaxID=69355 RepID=A0A7R9A7L9_9CRUS|nr:unnamed protein product [Darwinula stevensoni]CAG0892477.1 unnamed protein product [Darwinula stevensoni]